MSLSISASGGAVVGSWRTGSYLVQIWLRVPWKDSSWGFLSLAAWIRGPMMLGRLKTERSMLSAAE